MLHGKIICSLDSNKNNSNEQGLIRKWEHTVCREREGRTGESTILEQAGNRTAGLPLQKGRGAFERTEGKCQFQRRGKKEIYEDFRVRQTNTGIQKVSVIGICQRDDRIFLALGFIFQKESST